MELLLLLGITASVIYLSICTGWLMLTGQWTWTEEIRGLAHRIWAIGLSLAALVALIFLGPLVLLSTWPVWAVLIGAGLTLFAVTDLVHGIGWFRRQPPPRLITHRDGRRARVDRHYRPLD